MRRVGVCAPLVIRAAATREKRDGQTNFSVWRAGRAPLRCLSQLPAFALPWTFPFTGLAEDDVEEAHTSYASRRRFIGEEFRADMDAAVQSARRRLKVLGESGGDRHSSGRAGVHSAPQRGASPTLEQSTGSIGVIFPRFGHVGAFGNTTPMRSVSCSSYLRVRS